MPDVYHRYLPYFIPIAILLAFIQLFISYSSNFKRIVVPSIFQNLIKITLPLVILLFYWQKISLSQVVNGILWNYILVFLGLVLYIYYLKQLKLKLDFSHLTKGTFKEMRNFAAYGFFVGVGQVLALRIDSIMIASYIDLSSTGVYAIAAFIGNAIAIPTNAVNQITAPIVAQAFRDNELEEIQKLYQQSSINLLVVGLLLFVGVAVSVEDLFALMPKNESLQAGILVVILIGLSKVFDMGTSINNQIINYSPYYRFGFYAILLMAVFNVIANFLLIKSMGIIGVALATLSSLTLYNLVKLLFIWYRLKMQPFTRASAYLMLLAAATFAISYWLPLDFHPLVNILIRSTLVTVVYGSVVYYANLSPDIKELIQDFLHRLKK